MYLRTLEKGTAIFKMFFFVGAEYEKTIDIGKCRMKSANHTVGEKFKCVVCVS